MESENGKDLNSENVSEELLLSQLEFVAIDIETTGLMPARDEIIQIAAFRFKGNEVVDSYVSFVKPKGKVPKFIEQLTHISPEELKLSPPLKEVLKEFCDFIGNTPLVGHNINFDLSFINQSLVENGSFPLINVFWDTMEIARMYLPFTTDHKLSTMVSFFGIKLDNAHRADSDALATGYLFNALTNYALAHFNYMLNARLQDLSLQANVESGLTEYLRWLVKQQRATVLSGKKPIPPKNELNNVIEHNVSGSIDSIPEIFAEHGLFANKFPNFEFRSGQMIMAEQVANAFAKQDFLVVEAGTGVGKSFAYLVPAIDFSNRNKTKVIVSTNTKNLQEQLFFKDLPQLRKIIPLPFKAVLVKGRENYICERRWQDLLQEQTRGISAYDARGLLNLLVWKELTHTGDISENSSFDKNYYSVLWHKICSDRYLCGGRKCLNYHNCYVMKLRKHIESASIVVANHSLLLADAQMDNSTLGEYQYLIIDEAHNLMSAASKNLGFTFSYAELNSLFNQLAHSGKKYTGGFLPQLIQTVHKSILTTDQKTHIESLCTKLMLETDEQRKVITSLFNLAANRCFEAKSYNKLRIKDIADFQDIYFFLKELSIGFKNILKDLVALDNVLRTVKSNQIANLEIIKDNLNGYLQRYRETETLLLELLNPDLDNYALWIENIPRPERNIPSSTFCYAPVEVSEPLNRLLYKNIPCIVFTSATLSIRGSFKFFLNQSGLSFATDKKVIESIVESPFDYDKQSLLLIGSFLPEHKDRFFQSQALGCLEQILTTTNVGTMALFTSYKDLDAVYEHLSDTLYHSKRPFFAQGKGGSRNSILDDFKKSKNAVLLGTSSFWEGVDIQGDSLSLLILYKIPFQVPSEPLVEALIDKLERENKDSFMHLMLPNALLRLRQGFGRLIRSKTDRGIVLIMDSRVSKKKYGQYFKQILPGRCIELKNEQQLISEIGKFFSSLPSNL
ncbi:MAG TPA: helicase C-terminal domain-containing protein [Candidatus Cloacimonas sp.]|nr:DEAD/DEAH box helicase family protein [Candidatus Cloacimonas sp.]MDD2250226.1 helicase C-terminal domain-containing protein [Candidatus Cloacimonadota bacterium]MCK9157965.1 exonuclease domain-containing protein [Candidatus Cloacimonas sp.]MCK9165227.1 exonuclease domain-containing protein [Candidatus Cloacimonas sp.]MDD3734502.1 helicase C-terminal domain-containing protein [Candidatus Cloacimonadota bacterium]